MYFLDNPFREMKVVLRFVVVDILLYQFFKKVSQMDGILLFGFVFPSVLVPFTWPSHQFKLLKSPRWERTISQTCGREYQLVT
jgi:hypothetical protein